jgi:hypothetical protein
MAMLSPGYTYEAQIILLAKIGREVISISNWIRNFVSAEKAESSFLRWTDRYIILLRLMALNV